MDISGRFIQGKLLSELSTFGIGGPARFFSEARTIPEMQELLAYCSSHSLPFLIIGKGSNSLFDDRGYNGLVILNKIAFCEEKPEGLFYVGAGYSFSLLGVQTARNKWSGLEFASGIPASVGGAVYMNAGASGRETKESLVEVSYVTETGELQRLQKTDLEFGYRSSIFQKKRGAIVAASFQLTPSQDAREKQLGIVEYRTRTQPYGDPSAGCVFRNPSGGAAGALIEQCGLKGKEIGGARVSTLHANFIINAGGAKAQDVLELAKFVKETVHQKTGLDLEMEIRYIPYQAVQ
ncbi:MAG: UDP-N-acetylmuramate dehydrogenase [Chlamydiales bacterium]|nr:UDP-N-acetylmuramate dehydrogenase [Chlamydiales bacterium]